MPRVVSLLRHSVLILACMVLAISSVRAQDYPSRRITMVVGFAAGSGADILARFYATKLADVTGQTVVVENKPGANGMIAAQAVKQAKPDGYTILFSPSAGMAGGKFLYANLPYDPQKDFIIAAPLMDVAFTLAVSTKSPAKSVADLTALLKSKPKTARYGTANSTGIAATQVYKTLMGIEAQQVQYKTTGDALGDLADGTLDFMFLDGVFALAQQKAGKIRILATTNTHLDAAPGVPTMREAGVGNYSFAVWWMAMVPAGTSADVVGKLNAVFNKIAAMPETKAFLANVASNPLTGTPAEMIKKLDDDIKIWAEIAKAGNIQPQ
ncbi:MAG TPA: tripartite tricarboxylate transporter substrate binding protein [Xanthobacteraceae bacterium]|nr:tripartite tricarboxylate transporter substrate binding protein [Xanthobacteraceae bacterium]